SMTSFPEGMQRLPERLTQMLDDTEIRCNLPVIGLEKTERGWLVATGQESFSCSRVVLALPINQSLELLNSVEKPPLKTVPEAWITSVIFGFDSGSLPPGFGYLAPEREQRFSLGSLFSSNMFPNRAPDGHILLETLVGGRRHPERCCLDDETLIKEALADVRELIDLPINPSYTRVLRPSGGIPQLEKGYLDLLDWRQRLISDHSGLYVSGFGWEGIGLNDMIKAACSVSETIVSQRTQQQEEVEAKKIYF
ncbi:MAG: FAD-dependent oxidoreductase, partial [Desulfofustis sp.]